MRPSEPSAFDALLDLLRGRRVVVLSGAGCSTESGIPDYRGDAGRLRSRAPIRYGEFVGSPAARTRYWARSAVGWERFRRARPNDGHRALALLEACGLVRGVITQNVDGLHQEGGSRRVVELHGSLASVRCLGCGVRMARAGLQRRILALNPGWAARLRERPEGVEAAPDGDAELPDEAVRGFRVPECRACGGVLKPDVVFFGENVPKRRVARAWALFEEAEALLVLGSSLSVWSGRRFTERACRDGLPVALVNLGPTRADETCAVKVEDRLGRVLPRLAHALGERAERGRRSA